MIYFHPNDTREVIVRFALTKDWFGKIAQENQKLRKKDKPEKIPQAILNTLQSNVEGKEFIGITAYETALKKCLNEKEIQMYRNLLFEQSEPLMSENLALRFNFFRKMIQKKQENDKKQEPKKYQVQEIPDMQISSTAQGMLASIRRRQDLVMSEYAERLPVRKLQGKLDWRMVIGLGGEHIQETSMTLHHVYGIPYIPGSAVKGMVRHYFISQILEPECRSRIASFSKKAFQNLLEEFPGAKARLQPLFIEKDKTHEYDLSTLSDVQKQQIGEQVLARLQNHVLKERLDILNKIVSIPDLEDILKKNDSQKLRQEGKVVLKDSHGHEKPFFPREETIQKCLNGWSNLLFGQKIFGTQNQRGVVQFFDAYPVDKVTFEVDLMNPHYPDYYKEKSDIPPHDCQSPNPIKFLTVANTSFTFYLSYNPPSAVPQPNHQQENPELKTVAVWLENALKDQGIGAKSAVGYGYFGNVTDETEVFLDALNKERELAAQAAARLRWKSLSEVDRLCEELTTLENEHRGYEIFQQWVNMEEGEDKKKVAAALKHHWQNIGKWSGKITSKQKEKVEKIKVTLGE